MAKISKMHQRVINLKKNAVNPSAQTVEDANGQIDKDNGFWDMAQEHYNKSIEAIHTVEGEISSHLVEFTSDQEKIKLLPDPRTFAQNIELLNKDIVAHVAELDNIHNLHKDKSGSTKNIDEHLLVLDIQGKYAQCMEMYEANIIPTVAHILEDITRVEQVVSDRDNLTNPQVVSDVVDKNDSTNSGEQQ